MYKQKVKCLFLDNSLDNSQSAGVNRGYLSFLLHNTGTLWRARVNGLAIFIEWVFFRVEFKASVKFLKLEDILKRFLSTSLHHFHPKRYRLRLKKEREEKDWSSLILPTRIKVVRIALFDYLKRFHQKKQYARIAMVRDKFHLWYV